RIATRDHVLPLSQLITTKPGELMHEVPVPKGAYITASVTAYNRCVLLFYLEYAPKTLRMLKCLIRTRVCSSLSSCAFACAPLTLSPSQLDLWEWDPRSFGLAIRVSTTMRPVQQYD
ncbi:hypothetical protein EDD15DRAFT_2155132, partial [Pisolithus albus]